MKSPSDDIATILQTAGIGTKGTDLISGSLPDTKKTLGIGVIDTGGLDKEFNTGIEKPTVQIKVRGVKYDAVYSKIRQIVVKLSGTVDEVVGTTRYIHILENGQPFCLGLDDNNRYTYVANFRMERTSTI